MKQPTKVKTNNTCLKCGENKQGIRKHHMICGSVDSLTGELNQEWGPHQFTLPTANKKEI